MSRPECVWFNRSLYRSVSVAAVFLLIGAYSVPAFAQSFDELLRDYRAYGLPEAPASAQLVKLKSGVRSVAVDGTESPHFHLAFLLEKKGEGKARVLVGAEETQVDILESALQVVAHDNVELTDIYSEWSPWHFVGLNVGLATAIQCEDRGWTKLSKSLWEKSIATRVGHNQHPWTSRAHEEPDMALAKYAWNHWWSKLFLPSTDRAAIAKRLKSILERQPRLSDETRRAMLDSLDAALRPSGARPGSPEALIDDLMEITGKVVAFLDEDADPRYLKLVDMGFEAVPALIEHLDDPRLTRSNVAAFNNFPGGPRSVGDIVADLLWRLAGDELDRDWLDRQRGSGTSKEQARRWFAKARKQGEEPYLLAHVLPEGAEWPNQHILGLIARKYPQHIPQLYRKLLRDRSEVNSGALIDVIAAGNLSSDEKLSLIMLGAEHSELRHRAAAFNELMKRDRDRFVKLLIKTLDELPETPEGSYGTCDEATFAEFALEANDDGAWDALSRAAKRADVGLRMEFLERAGYGAWDTKELTRLLRFLSQFLNDATLRDATVSEKYDDFSAEFIFEKLEVRDFAAMQIAEILDVKQSPKPDWSAQQWSEFRAVVETLLKVRERSRTK